MQNNLGATFWLKSQLDKFKFSGNFSYISNRIKRYFMPGFHIITGNRLEDLAHELTRHFTRLPLPPLVPETVIVQSRGMQHWLQLFMAEQTGICANIAFTYPKAFLWGLLEDPDAVVSPWDAAHLTWNILGLFPELAGNPRYERLERFWGDDPLGPRAFQLAGRIAGCFDAYLIYRPDMILAWDRGENPAAGISTDADWQMGLWQRLTAAHIDASHAPGAGPRHPAARAEGFQPDAVAVTGRIPERITIFGISALPPLYLHLFQTLATRMDVFFYYLNPCREYWEYIYSEKTIARIRQQGIREADAYMEQGNPLLASMGTAGRAFFSLMIESAGGLGQEVFSEPAADTLLSALQADILALRDRAGEGGEKTPVPVSDDSVRIHLCHSPIREIEVLYDRLLDMMNRDPALQPRDVVVMMPDVGVYAPIIRAVFDHPEDEALRIPYTIADASRGAENQICDAFFGILAIDDNRFKASAVMDILAAPAVRRRFGITEPELETIDAWVRDAGICWGLDSTYRKRLGLPGFHENTWAFGLDRLLLGYALPPSRIPGDGLFADMLPCGGIGESDAVTLGRFVAFIDALRASVELLDGLQPPAVWAGRLEQILSLCFLADDDDAPELQELRDVIAGDGLAARAAHAGFTQPVSMAVIRRFLKSEMAAETRPFGFISRGVTFCSLLPMRSIPFDVVCLVGMDDGVYPRDTITPGFDLISAAPRLGDRSKRHEDRYLFLEALLSARKKFYISYLGQSLKDNTILPPSVLVSELVDVINGGFCDASGGDLLVSIRVIHPLQAFSRRYYTGEDSGLFSYSAENCRAAAGDTGTAVAAVFFPSALPDLPPVTSIDLDALIRFWSGPAAYLLDQRLDIGLYAGAPDPPPDREPFEMDGLDRYRLLTRRVADHLEGRLSDQRVRAMGVLPHGIAGDLLLESVDQDATVFSNRVSDLITGTPIPPRQLEPVRLACDAQLTGQVPVMYAAGMVVYRAGNVSGRDLIHAWLRHLAVHAEGRHPDIRTWLVTMDKACVFSPVPQGTACDILDNLVRWYQQGMNQPLPFFPGTSHAYARSRIVRGKSHDAALADARKYWDDSYQMAGEQSARANRLCFPFDFPDPAVFAQIADAFFSPLFRFLDTEERG